MDKHDEYVVKLVSQIGEMFDEESENFIDVNELTEGDNMTQFAHAIANSMPNVIVSKMTNEVKSNLEFNYMANRLCFQYSNKK